MQRETTNMQAVVTAVRDIDAPARVAKAPEAFLLSLGVDERDIDELAREQGQRLLMYRQLVHSRLLDAVQSLAPMTSARRGPGQMNADMSLFIDEQAPSTAYLRDVAAEFMQWVAPRWERNDDLPGYLTDLGRFELFTFEVGVAARLDLSSQVDSDALELDRAVRFDTTAQLATFSHRVHELPEDEYDRSDAVAGNVTLLGYRDRDNEVRLLDLGPVAARVLARLLPGELPLGEAIQTGCADANVALDDDVLAGIAELLSDLVERGVLLGSVKIT